MKAFVLIVLAGCGSADANHASLQTSNSALDEDPQTKVRVVAIAGNTGGALAVGDLLHVKVDTQSCLPSVCTVIDEASCEVTGHNPYFVKAKFQYHTSGNGACPADCGGSFPIVECTSAQPIEDATIVIRRLNTKFGDMWIDLPANVPASGLRMPAANACD